MRDENSCTLGGGTSERVMTDRASWLPRMMKQGRSRRRISCGEEQARAVVPPVGVIQVAGDDDERDILGDRQVDQVGERSARAVLNDVLGHAAAAGKAGQRAVQVNIGGVQELHEAGG